MDRKQTMLERMEDACTNGTVDALQELHATDPMSLSDKQHLLKIAISHRQLHIVEFLLRVGPPLTISHDPGLVNAVLDHPNAVILQVLIDYEPEFASSEIDYHGRVFLTDACFRPPAEISPVIHVLVDNGADVTEGGFGPNTGALWAAIQGGQPLEIVDKIAEKYGPVTTRCAMSAIQRGDIPILKRLFWQGTIENRASGDLLLECARDTRNPDINAIVRSWAEREGKVIRANEIESSGVTRTVTRYCSAM